VRPARCGHRRPTGVTWRHAGFANQTVRPRAKLCVVSRPVEIRRLERDELRRVAEIDRTEHIDLLYEQHGTELVERHGNWDSPAWDPDGHGDYSVEAKQHELEQYIDAGGIALGALSGPRIVAIGAVVPHLRRGIASSPLFTSARRSGLQASEPVCATSWT
jgi:hypothetical protein